MTIEGNKTHHILKSGQKSRNMKHFSKQPHLMKNESASDFDSKHNSFCDISFRLSCLAINDCSLKLALWISMLGMNFDARNVPILMLEMNFSAYNLEFQCLQSRLSVLTIYFYNS